MVAYPNLITHETFERDIKKLTGLGDKTLFKVELLHIFLNQRF